MDQAVDFQAIPRVVAGRARGGRDAQQDDMVCLHDAAQAASLLVLADGMGGDGAGELASAGVIEVARRYHEDSRASADLDPVFRRLWEDGARVYLPRAEAWLREAAPAITTRLTRPDS